MYSTIYNVKCRGREAKREGTTKVVGIDGSHLHKKQQKFLSEGEVIGRLTALPKPLLAG